LKGHRGREALPGTVLAITVLYSTHPLARLGWQPWTCFGASSKPVWPTRLH